MAILTFHDLKFRSGSASTVTIEFLGNYKFEVDKEALLKIGRFRIEGGIIEFEGVAEANARERFNAILNYGLANLTNTTTKKKTLYIHRFSGIPLIGTANFGIIDRNNNMIEVRPLTGCNMNCIFCSVDEGMTSKKTTDVVVEEEYLASEVKKLVEFKGCECHIIINSQGEPTIYRPLPELIRDLRAIAAIKTITLITNGTCLTEELIDKLAAAGLTMMNISLNAIDPKIAKIMEGHGGYDVEKVKKMARYAAGTKIKISLAPVVVGGYNEEEMKKIVAFAKEIGATTAIQNFLSYKKGRNPKNAEQILWPKFYEMMESLQEKYGSKMIFSASDYSIIKTKALPKPFRKGQVVKAEIIAEGRYPNEHIAAAGHRIITLPDMKKKPKPGEKLKIRIVSDKHNIFYGEAA